MTPTNEQINEAAENYANNENSCWSNDYTNFIAGIEWYKQQLASPQPKYGLGEPLHDGDGQYWPVVEIAPLTPSRRNQKR